MARVTVEDCIVKIPNRFNLVMVATQRSRELSVGDELTVERDNDKNPVVALREIAEATVDIDALQNSLIQGLQKHIDMDDPIEDADDLLAVEEALSELGGLGDAPRPDAAGKIFAEMSAEFENIDDSEDADADAGTAPEADEKPADVQPDSPDKDD